MRDDNFEWLCKYAVLMYYNCHRATSGKTIGLSDIYVAWLSRTQQKNGTALLRTTADDDMYYEVTCNSDEGKVYLHAYKKFGDVTIDSADIASLEANEEGVL